jgi:hypothetical protein
MDGAFNSGMPDLILYIQGISLLTIFNLIAVALGADTHWEQWQESQNCSFEP